MKVPLFSVKAQKLLGFCAFSLLCFAPFTPLEAQGAGKRYRPQADYVEMGVPDPAEGRRLMAEFRDLGIQGDYYLEFELRHLPRRGEEKVFEGRLWGGRRDQGAWTRIQLASGAKEEDRYLLLNGPAPKLWMRKPGDKVEASKETDLFAPIAQSILTPFDLQMPYLYWPDFDYEGLTKVRGRPAHRFLMHPPETIQGVEAKLTGVRISLDSQYKALVQTQSLGVDDKILKTFVLLELKKVAGQWIVKSLEVRDEVTRDKTRMTVKAAALGQDFVGSLFEAEALADGLERPAGVLELP